MPISHIGDLSRNYALQSNSARLRDTLGKLTNELSSGFTANTGLHLKGQMTELAGVFRLLNSVENYNQVATETQSLADAKQAVMTSLNEEAVAFSAAALTAAQSNQATAFATMSERGQQDFSIAVSRLNLTVAGRSAFSGEAVDSASLLGAEDMLALIENAVSGSTDATDFITRIDDWFFSTGGGFETQGYLGATTDMSALKISPSSDITLTTRADDNAIRSILRNYAIATLAADTGLNFSTNAKAFLFETAAENMLSAQSDLTILQADLGYTQSRIENAIIENNAALTSQSIVRNQLLAVDPYDTATELEAATFQLDALYTVTSRLASLRLTGYL